MQIIKFDRNAIKINCIVKIGFTRSAYQDLCKFTPDPETRIAALSKLSRFIVVPREDSDDMFSLQTSFGNFFCGINHKTEDGFSIVSYRENDLQSQNTALREGIIFNPEDGVSVEMLLPDMGLQFKYLSGAKYDYNALDCGDTKLSANIVMDAIYASKRKKKGKPQKEASAPIQSVEPIEIDYDALFLKEVLKQAEQYSILSGELEEKKIHEMGRLSYRRFHASDYDRTDRIAYEFLVDDIDKNVFKAGVQVELEGMRQERINGEIIEINDSDKENIKIIILFHAQISIEMIKEFGWISLSFSTVNKDVQLAANTRIADGSAKAKYMKDVLGCGRTSGFAGKDLSNVRKKLNEKKYPPNESQMMAIEKGINAKDIFLVMGPPGTGKTTVILEWVKYFVGVEHKRVLISSQNNKAVDNVLARLAEEKDIDVIRIGSEAKLQQEVIPYMFENKLTALNQSIDFSTKHTIDKLENAIHAWTAYKKSLFLLHNRLMEKERITADLRESIESQLFPIRSKMKTCYEEYQEYASKHVQAGQRHQECLREIERYLTGNPILKKLSETHYQENLGEKGKLEVLIGQYYSRMNEAGKKYNRYSELFESQKIIMRDKFVKEMKQAQKQVVREIDKICASLPEKPQMAGLFDNTTLDGQRAASSTKLKELSALIDKELARATDILEVEKAWRSDIVGKQNYALNEIILETVNLVGATCIGVSSQKRFANLQFDVTIIDEAGQIQIHNALVPMSVSNKLIMLGDYKQIPPSADQDLVKACELNCVDTELLKKSLFEKLFVELPETNKMMLDTQYRMPGEIADIISEWFYQSEYKSPDFKRNLQGILPGISPKPLVVIDTSNVDNRSETRTEEKGTYNILEANICGEILRYYIAENGTDAAILSEIGIISAYGDQVARIKKTITKTKMVSSEQANAMVATLDSFQGQERDLILYSFTKSSTKKATMSRIGFLNELRRLNVAMSRCKKTLVMIGDMKFLSGCLYQDIDEEGNRIYEHSEKEFSDFIQKMLGDIKGGRGEILDYIQFRERLGL